WVSALPPAQILHSPHGGASSSSACLGSPLQANLAQGLLLLIRLQVLGMPLQFDESLQLDSRVSQHMDILLYNFQRASTSIKSGMTLGRSPQVPQVAGLL
ncbi:unnamed protein product, partial [Urochloa humidicola]